MLKANPAMKVDSLVVFVWVVCHNRATAGSAENLRNLFDHDVVPVVHIDESRRVSTAVGRNPGLDNEGAIVCRRVSEC